MLITDSLRQWTHRQSLPPEVTARANQLALGTVRDRRFLDALLTRLARKGLPEHDPRLLDILRLGAYELTGMGNRADYGTVDSFVELAKSIKGPKVGGFVNALLRSIASLSPEDLGSQRAELPAAVGHGLPDWLWASSLQAFPEDAASQMSRMNLPAPIWVRVTPQESLEVLCRSLSSSGVLHEQISWLPQGLKVSHSTPPYLSLPFVQGRFWPQDAASQLVVDVASRLPPGDWLDVCAGQGTKTLALASMPHGTLTATDLSQTRLQGLQARLDRVTAPEVRVLTADMTSPPFPKRSFDLVLLDAPCTGLGTLRHHPELRWIRQPEDIPRAAQLQSALLAGCAPLVRPGGILLYAVCSFHPREGEAQIRRFLEIHPEFEPASPIRGHLEALPFPTLSATMEDSLARLGGMLVPPAWLDSDAFFLAALRRREIVA
jgi:16S rRNA (cytosine967-C5)-methyltransferase